MIISSPSHKLSDVERRGAFGYGACKQEVMGLQSHRSLRDSAPFNSHYL